MTLSPSSSRSGGGLALLASSTLPVAAASIDFQNIDQGYAHLLLMVRAKTDLAALASEIGIRFNNDSGANYAGNFSQVVGGVPGGAAGAALSLFSAIFAPGSNADADAFGTVDAFIPFYTGNRRKTIHLGALDIPNSTATDFRLSDYDGQWRNTAAITRITIVGGGVTNLVAGSSAALYGLAA